MSERDPEVASIEDALDIMDDLDGRDVITAEKGREIAAQFGADIDDIVKPTDRHLPYRDDETPAVAMHELANEILVSLGGERQTSPLTGRGSSADFEYDNALPKIKERVEEDDE